MADNLQTILLSTVLRQNANNTTSPTNAFNLNSTAVQAYLTQKLKGILPNATGNITENELMTAWLLANSGGGGGGTVTSVGLDLPSIFTVTVSPITTSGDLTATLTSQAANTVLAAPNGSSGTPTFRALVAADIPQTTRLNDNDTVNFYDYCGQAPLGTAQSAAVWLIRRIEWATTTPITKEATGAWTSRASLTYI